MRYLIAAATAAMLATQAHADTMAHCSRAWDNMSVAAKAKTTYQNYSSMCLKSDYVVATATSAMTGPAGATGQCKDGTYTTSKSHAGACSQHGGVAKWL
jgi:hypothetical protein